MTPIGIIYFKEKVKPDRQIHTVNDLMLTAWIYYYKKSGTKMKPCLLTDKNTEISKDWPYDVAVIKDAEPPQKLDVLNKVGWMKSQGYKVLGRCIVMDLDCMILKSIDDLDTLDSPMAMPVDPARRTYADWPEVGEELNAGTMLFNSEKILPEFRKWWNEKPQYQTITYFDEIIFSAICRQNKGVILSTHYNASWPTGDDKGLYKAANNTNTKILHFHGNRKLQLPKFFERNKLGLI